MNFLKKKWPFWVNSLMVVFMVLLGLYLFNDTLGSAQVFKAFSGYASDALQNKEMPKIDWTWQIALMCGVFAGALCGALIHGSWKLVLALEDAQSMTGKALKTAVSGVVSGFLIMFGTIISGEVFYGQVAAAMELSAGAWFFLVTACAVGGITALFIERRNSASSGKGE